MVTRLTNYTKQFWILLSTDDMDTLGSHNGDEAIVIDRDERYVFDEENRIWRQIPMSGGGGGGGEKTLTRLAAISIQEPVSTVAITATDAMKSCDRLYIKLQNVTLSAEDWVYPYINDTPGSSGGNTMGYIDKAQTYAVLFELIRFGGAVDGSVIETAYQFGPNRLVSTANTRLADSLTEINFRLYAGATTFTGGTIEVWGYV